MTEGHASPQHATASHDPPRAVAGYPFLRLVGQGGMSAVYQSYDVRGCRPVAVKILADHLAGQPEFVSRFYREARLSRLLDHPTIVKGFASGFDPDVSKHYLALEYIDGPTAHGALRQSGRLPVGAVVRIGIDIARALAFLHECHYVHRDVKPDNILLHPSGVAKLADLGLAKRLNDDAQLTAVNQGVGTTYYMPYEQAVNANLVDGRSDIFALGATLYHLLTGEVPYPGATHNEVIRGKAYGAFRPLRDAFPGAPAALAGLIEATLACDPRARVQKASQLADALTELELATPLTRFPDGAGGSGSASAPVPETPTRADLAVPDGPGESSTPPLTSFCTPSGPPARSRFGLWRWAVGAGALLAALAVLGLARPLGETAPPTSVAGDASARDDGLPLSCPQ